MKRTMLITLLLVLALGLVACGPGQEGEADPGAAEPKEVEPTASPEPTATATPEPTPTPVGGAAGQFLYTSSVREKAKLEGGLTLNYTGYQLNKMDLATGESEVLIDKDLISKKMNVDLARTRFSPSPDGSLIMVTASTKVTFDSFDEFENFIVSGDTRTMIPILDAGATAINWTWSPDGTMLLGDTLIDNNKAVYLVNSDGSGLRKLIQSPVVTSPAWSADGSKVYWLALGVPMSLDLTAEDSEPEMVVDTPGSLFAISFAPNGEKAAYITDAGKLFVTNSDFSSPVEMPGTYVSETCQGKFGPQILKWSEDGQYLILSSNFCMPLNNVLFPNKTTYLVDLVNKKTELSLKADSGEICGWAPDGSFVYKSVADDAKYLIIGEIGQSESEFELEGYSGSCPSWIK